MKHISVVKGKKIKTVFPFSKVKFLYANLVSFTVKAVFRTIPLGSNPIKLFSFRTVLHINSKRSHK